MPATQITEYDIGDVTVLNLSGHFVLGDGEPGLRNRFDALLARGRMRVVLNLHDVTYIDSCGIGTLVEEFKRLRRGGGDLKLVCPSQRCEHVLALTHLLPLFELYESDDEAARSLSRSLNG